MATTRFERDVLRVLNGEEIEDIIYGAAFNAACSYLRGRGFVTSPPYTITNKGKEFLDRPLFAKERDDPNP